MAEDITAFQFDDALRETTDETEDKTVETIGQDLWFHYDDCRDHKIVASKELWDYFNRVLLVLESDGEMGVVRTVWHWNFRQVVAAVCLIVFAFLAFQVGFGKQLLACAAPFGVISMILARLAYREEEARRSRAKDALAPFSSIGNLRSIRRQMANFTRTRYPKALTERSIRTPVMTKILWIPSVIGWLIFSPAPLFFQMLPDREIETRIKLPEQTARAGGASAAKPSR